MPTPAALLGTLTRSQGAGAQVRISNTHASALIGVALFFDAVQFMAVPMFVLPGIGGGLAIIIPFIITCSAFIVLGFWFALKRVNFLTGEQKYLKLIAAFGSLVIDIMPIISALPAITMGTVVVIIGTRIEDTVGKKKELDQMIRQRSRNEARVGRIQNPAVQQQAQQRLAARQRADSNRMAAQFTQGKRNVGDRVSERSIPDLQTGLGVEVDSALARDRSGPRGRLPTYNSWSEDQKRRYRIAMQRKQTRARFAREAQEEFEAQEG